MPYRSLGTAPVWVLFTRYNPSDFSSMGPPAREAFPAKICCLWPTFHGQQFLPGAFSRVRYPWGHREHMPVVCCPSWSPGRVSTPPQFSVCCRAISALASGAPSPSPPPQILHWHLCLQGCVLCQTVLLLSHRCCRGFLPFQKYVITGALPTLFISSALDSNGSVLEWTETSFAHHGSSFSHLLTETTSVVPLLPNPCQVNPIQCRVLWYLLDTTYGLEISCSAQHKEFKPRK